ncbi:uncharacterized protein B0H18DRAFT_974561 [Fomitopsis serialis]|uniref:uncharacterized protein n=1 Tax=Fomitopsis serialis TaxID=139415 RepID=UPI0020074D08|nr:uncharacterized protein B0H18DRAFT_974561 [Neoantrodia serialis]KAH9936597.1 hypothetical protein B0H18DRAFT_974561 [Neoantrodia serialis]
MPRVHRMVKAPMTAVPSPAYKPVRSRPFTIIEAVQTGTSVVAVNHLRTLPVAKAAPTSSLSEPKVKRGPSPLSQSFWTSPDESIPRTPAVPAVPSAMNWEPVPPPMICTLSSTTASSSSSIPPTPIDEDTVMVDVFDVDFSASVDVLPFAEDKHAKPEDSTLLPSRPMKPLPVRRRPRAPVEVPMPPAASTDDEAGTLIASDSELERQLWADMNDILGHEDEPARFCFPPEGIPAVAFLPASVPPPVVAVVGRSFPAFSANDADSDSDESLLEAFHPAAKTVPEVVVTPATPAVVSRADFKEAGTQRSVVAPARSMDDLWEEFFGPEVDV